MRKICVGRSEINGETGYRETKSEKGLVGMKMIVFLCKSPMCETHFALEALEKESAVFDGEELVCPACSGHEWVELGPAEVPLPKEPAEKVVVRRTCRGCGCTQYNACDGGCWWVEDDLCSECVTDEERSVGEGEME